jgi:hypothetical protein
MHKSSAASDCERLEKVKLVVVIVEEQFKVLVREKVACVWWDAAECHNMGAFPKPKESFLCVEYLNYTLDALMSAAGLNMRLNV